MISLVVATSGNRAIGRANQLLWHLPNDLKFFKRITGGHTVIMGRKTFESIGKALPNRRNIVVSRQTSLKPEGVEVAASFEKALAMAKDEQEIFVIGGAQIYKQALPMADRIYLTLVAVEMEGDAYFPEWVVTDWKLVEKQDFPADEKHAYAYSFLILDRIHSDR